MITFLPPLAAAGLGIDNRPILTSPYPLWLTAAQTGSLAVVLLLASGIAGRHATSAWKRWRGGEITLGEDASGSRDKRKPPKNLKEAQDREIWENVRGMMPERDEPIGLELFWRRAVLHHAGLLLVSLPAFLIMYDLVEPLLTSGAQWTVLLPIITYIASSIVQTIIALSLMRNHERLEHHTIGIQHYFLLAMFGSLSQYTLILGPSLVPHHILTFDWWTASPLLLSLAQLIYSGLIPRGPTHRLDKRHLYTRAIQTALEKGNTSAEDEMDPTSAPKLRTDTFGDESVSVESSLCIFAWLGVQWVVPVISVAARMPQIDVQHLPALRPSLRSQEIAEELHTDGHMELEGLKDITASRLFGRLCKAQGGAISAWLVLCIIRVPLDYLPHVSLQMLLTSITGGSRTMTAVSWAGMLIAAKTAVNGLQLVRANYDSVYIAPRMRSHAMLLVYRKLLTRNTYSVAGNEKTDAATANVNPLNLITQDVSDLINILSTIQSIATAQIELVLAGLYVWSLLGISGLFGLSTLIFTAIPGFFFARLEYRIRTKLGVVRDERMSLMQEAIQAISMIKMMAAEAFWHRRIMTVRDREFAIEFRLKLLSLISGLLQSMGPNVILAISFAHYTLVRKQTLTAAVAFTAINVFGELRPILERMPTYITEFMEELVAARRVAAFLRIADIEPLESLDRQRQADRELSIKGALTWTIPTGLAEKPKEDATQPAEPFKLTDLDVVFPRGKMTLVAGRFGSGKTLLLLGLLGEAHLIEGEVTYAISTMLPPSLSEKPPVGWSWSIVTETVAYTPQTAWLISASIRDNILFGLPMDIARYRQVVHAVGLLPDLAILDDADLTQIGERGKVLSGGQKARVSLARAMYSRAATIILDDIISAVDATTSQHIIQYCFNSDLMQERTIVIASHAVESLAPLAHQALFLEDSRVVFTGTGDELLRSDYMRHLATDSTETGDDTARDDADNHTSGLASHDFVVKESVHKTPRQLIVEDARSDGNIKMNHWWDLIKANGGWLHWIGIAIFLLLNCSMPLLSMKILALWTEDVSEPSHQSHRVEFWLALYCTASISGSVVFEVGYFFLWRGAFRAMKDMHREILSTMLRASIPYFSKTRSGSIIQRFGRDLHDVISASWLIFNMASRIVTITLTTITVSMYGGWPFALATVFMLALLYKPSTWYRSASRQMRRLEMIIPGLVTAIYSETIAGSAVVRAFGAHSVMVNDLLQTLNMRQCANTWRLYTSQWLFSMFKLLDVGMLAAVLAVILLNSQVSASTAGFLITFVEGLSISLNWALLDLRNIELDGISLERLADFRKIPQEQHEPLDIAPSHDNTPVWPSKGVIVATDLCARYEADLPDILHEVGFEIAGGTKVGIVGASGGGKSTLAKALFSFVQISSGKIEIDGVDISTVQLSRLRSSLGIIAQDPILLSGSLRLNLDIESQYSDADLYEALRQVQLIKVAGSKAVTPAVSRAPSIKSAPEEAAGESDSLTAASTVAEADATIFNDLDFEIKTGGENAGQKQLVVLARAILRQHKILIMDEATASIDSETDQAISRIVHDGFKGATVLIIAHRLRTIMPCAKILVMDKGRIAQQGSPVELIRQQGKFKELCEAAGKEEYAHLCSIAETEAKRNDGYLVPV